MNKGVFFYVIGLLLLVSCETHKKDKPLIVCTTSIIADPLQQILSPHFEVHALMGNGVDPHSFKPGLKDLEWLEAADIIVMNGALLEGKMAEVFHYYSNEKVVLSMLNGNDNNSYLFLDENNKQIDQHFWFDISLWKNALNYVSNSVLKSFAHIDSASIIANRKAYFLKMDSVENSNQKLLNEVPSNKRVLVTTHDAFQYFARAYNYEVYALQGVSTILEPGLKDMNNLVDLVSDRKIPAVFVESNLSSKSIESLISGCKARGHIVQLGGSLYADCPGPKGSIEGTYLGMLSANVKQLNSALK